MAETVQRRRIFICPQCRKLINDSAVSKRRQKGFNWIYCGVDKSVLQGAEEGLKATCTSLVSATNLVADTQRDYAGAATILQGKRATRDFDVFFCRNEADRSAVKEIGESSISVVFFLASVPGLPDER